MRAIAQAPALGMATLVDDGHDSAGQLAAAWDRLRLASSVMETQAADQEYADLFIGVGKSEVNLHASHWITGFMMDKPLVEVRATLARLGLARQAHASMVEDHIAALFETMRLLISGLEGGPPSRIEDQQDFFERHIAPWAPRCCAAIRANSVANYYRRVAELTDSFMTIERDSFAMV
ncbi:MAG TPA: molecular chaperone TorD family protein [Casimicrobiaceae bacterium]|nr:molecular chaperone TorD family protein [Casimicrobiaceae bacterium]